MKKTMLGVVRRPWGDIRGVVARRDIKKGETIIEVPFECSVVVGEGGRVEDLCRGLRGRVWREYWDVMPGVEGDDFVCL